MGFSKRDKKKDTPAKSTVPVRSKGVYKGAERRKIPIPEPVPVIKKTPIVDKKPSAVGKKTLIARQREPVARHIPHPPKEATYKYVQPKEQIPPKPFVEDYNLPTTYGKTQVTLVARDPHWLYAYWEIAGSSIEQLKREIGDAFNSATHVLRMYDVTLKDFDGTNANHYFDIDVGPHANTWYISLWNDNVTHCAEIGIRIWDGRFFRLARSNFVTTPRSNSSGRSELIWMDVKDSSSQPYVFLGQQRKAAAGENPRNRIGVGRRRFYLTEDDIRLYYSKMFPLLSRVISKRLARTGKRGWEDFVLIEDNTVTIHEMLLRGMNKEEFIRRFLLGSSAELLIKGGASEELINQPASEQKKQPRKFFFEIGTELIVYGRTEPDAEVWLGDKQIPLRKDGTFTLRFALPDGKIPLDFTANSNDKVDKRIIKTSVERAKTVYDP